MEKKIKRDKTKIGDNINNEKVKSFIVSLFDKMSLENMEMIGKGAEAYVYTNRDVVLKVRPKKYYRIDEIDVKIRRERTRREAKILSVLNNSNISAPLLIDYSDKEMYIEMSYIDGKKLRDVLTERNIKAYAQAVATLVGKLHNLNIVHQDLTTSNFIVRNGELFIIDFGLSFFSNKAEDRAVDIHLLKRAIESKHSVLFNDFIESFFEAYSRFKFSKEVIERIKKVELRGRYKGKKGKSL